MKQIALIASMLLLMSSFNSRSTTDSDILYHTKWQLKSIHSKDEAAYIFTNAFINFDQEKKQVNGNGSCNNFGGSFVVKDDTIHFGQLVSTRMYCESVQKIETDFFAALGKVNRFEIKGNSLLMYQGEQLLLEFGS